MYPLIGAHNNERTSMSCLKRYISAVVLSGLLIFLSACSSSESSNTSISSSDDVSVEVATSEPEPEPEPEPESTTLPKPVRRCNDNIDHHLQGGLLHDQGSPHLYIYEDGCTLREVLIPNPGAGPGSCVGCYNVVAISPDGQRVAFDISYIEDELESNIYIMATDGTNLEQLTGFEDTKYSSFGDISWSHDGEYLAFERRSSTGAIVNGETVSPWTGSNLFTIRSDGTQLTALTEEPEVEGSWQQRFLWSPNENRLLSIQGESIEGNYQQVYQIVNPDGTDPLVLIPPIMLSRMPTWSPDGTQLAGIGFLSSEPYKIFVLDLLGNSKDLIEMSNDSERIRSLRWAPDKDQFAFIKYDRITEEESLLMVNVANGDLIDFGSFPIQSQPSSFSWSTDGTALLWSGYPNVSDNQVDIVVFELPDNIETLVTSNLSITGNPVWVSRDS